MKPSDTLPISTSATASAIVDVPATLHGASTSNNNQLNVPANGRRLSRGGNRSVKCIGTEIFNDLCHYRVDIDSTIGVRISIFGPEENTDTDTASKDTSGLPSFSLCEDDVHNGPENPTLRFICKYIVGNNEKLRFMILQKNVYSRWGPFLFVHSFLDSITSILNVHNVISAILCLIPLLIWQKKKLLDGFICFTLSWIFVNFFSFDRDILPSFFFFGYNLPDAEDSKPLPMWMVLLIVIAGSFLSSGISNYAKVRNVPTLLLPYFLLLVLYGIVQTNVESLSKYDPAQYFGPDLILLSENDTTSFHTDMIINTRLNISDMPYGAELIFYSVIKSPGVIFNVTTPVSCILLCIGLVLFSPYMSICCLEGAAMSSLIAMAFGFETDDLFSNFYCLPGI